MRSPHVRRIVGLMVIAAVGMLFNATCIGFAGEQFLRTVDFCFLFDCQNGALGGLIDPCPGTLNSDGSTTNLFVDCPLTEDG